MSDDYQFSIRRSWAFVLAGCCAAATVLLFFAGTIAGLLLSGSHGMTAQVVAPPSAAKATQHGADHGSEGPVDAAAASAAEPPSATPIPASDPASDAAPAAAVSTATPSSPTVIPAATAAAAALEPSPASSSANPATAVATASAPTKPPAAVAPAAAAQPVDTSLAIPLEVQVGAFMIKSNAETLVQSLRDMGYKPAMGRSTDTRGRVWYVVRLGPYAKWNAASRVAARIAITENVRPVIGPMQ
jgi:cell division septation protein DedD